MATAREASPTSRLEGRWVRLRPTLPEDIPRLYAIAMQPGTSIRWRFAGHTPSPEEFTQTLWRGVLVQMCVESRGSTELLGLVTIHDADHPNSVAHCSALVAPWHQRRGAAIESVVVLLDYAFANWPFRKIYFDVPKYNVASVSTLLSVGDLESSLKDRILLNGRYWDLLTISIGPGQLSRVKRLIWRGSTAIEVDE